MKTVEQLEAELKEALARERQLREAVEGVFPLIIAGNARALAYHFEKGEPLGGVTKEALCVWLRSVRDHFESFSKALITPAPRVFTLEEVKPLVEALEDVQNCHRQDNEGLDLYWVGETSFTLVHRALAHARKLGIEDKP